MADNRYALYSSHKSHVLDIRRVLDAETHVAKDIEGPIESLERFRADEKTKEALEVLSVLQSDLEEVISEKPDKSPGQVFSL